MSQDRKEISRIDSEIALTAFLATAVSMYQVPSFEYNQIITLLGISLLLITLIRRMALFEGDEKDSKLMTVSNVILYSSTTICVTYLAYASSTAVSSLIFPDSWIMFLFAHTTLLIGLLLTTIKPIIMISEMIIMFGNVINMDVGKAARQISESAEELLSESDPSGISIFRAILFSIAGTVVSGVLTGATSLIFGYRTYYLTLLLGVFAIHACGIIWYSRYGVVRYKHVLESSVSSMVNVINIIGVLVLVALFILYGV